MVVPNPWLTWRAPAHNASHQPASGIPVPSKKPNAVMRRQRGGHVFKVGACRMFSAERRYLTSLTLASGKPPAHTGKGSSGSRRLPCFLAGPVNAQIAIAHTNAVQTRFRDITPQLASFPAVGINMADAG